MPFPHMLLAAKVSAVAPVSFGPVVNDPSLGAANSCCGITVRGPTVASRQGFNV